MSNSIKTITLTEFFLIIITFSKSFWLGLCLSIYILYIKDKHKKIRDQLNACLTEDKNEKPKMLDIKRNPDKKYSYKGCKIEQYDKWFIIVKPNKKRLNSLFNNLEEAKEEIDIIYPFLIDSKRRK